MSNAYPTVRRLGVALLAGLFLLGGAACSGDDGDSGADASTTTSDGAGDAVGDSGVLSVLAYNVAGLPAEISGGNPGVAMPIISPLLNDYDIVLTQEDFDWWPDEGTIVDLGLDFVNYHERLRADATHEYQSPRHPGPDAAGVDPESRPDLEIGDGIGIMARHPLDDYAVQAWAGCFGSLDTSDGGAADCPAMKGFRVATMDLGGTEVDVYSLHAEAGGTDEDQRLQAEDFEQLAAFIEEHSGDRALIIGGDTNLHTDDEHEDNGDGLDTEIWATFVARIGLTDACVATDCEDTGAIDKIAIRSSDAIELEVTGYERPQERFTDDEGGDLSDHVPVAVELAWRRLA